MYLMLHIILFVLFILFKSADIGLILDDSVSVFDDDFQKEKEFVYRIYEKVDPLKSGSRISVGKFSTEASMIIKFSDQAATNQESARKILECSTPTKGGTCINKALQIAGDKMFAPEFERNETKILVLLTDGSCNCAGCSEMVNIGNTLKDRKISIVTIGIGYGVDEQELMDISSSPSTHFTSKNFDDLIDIFPKALDSLTKIDKQQDIERNETAMAAKAEILAKSERTSEAQKENKTERLILNSSEYLKEDSQKSENKKEPCKDCYPLNPIIVNIQTCPQSRVHHIGCKPGASRCFQIEQDYLLTPSNLAEELCRCSELALKNNLNYFKIDDNGLCTIGTSNAEECGKKRSTLLRNVCKRKEDAIYRATFM